MDLRISIRRREMDPKMFNCPEKKDARDRNIERFQMLHASSDVEHEKNHTFLKVTPALFTQDKLALFDSLDLYTSLIKCSKFMEQGERLHNLSWRIINKSLLKDQDINKSKTKDGVRNLYNVITPIKQTHTFHRLPKLKAPGAPHAIQDRPENLRNGANSVVRSASGSGSTSQISISRKLLSSKSISPEPIPLFKKLEVQGQPQVPAVRSGTDLRKDIVKRSFPVSPDVVHVTKKSYEHAQPGFITSHLPIVSEPKSQASLFSRNPSSKSLFSKNAGIADDTTSNNNSSATNIRSQKTSGNTSGNTSDAEQASSSSRLEMSVAGGHSETFFQKANGSSTAKGANTAGTGNQHAAAAHTSGNGHEHRNMFFSSEDEESDWDSLSDDSEICDDDEDSDQYYEKQWDKLMFSKTSTNHSGHHVPAKDSGEKKSLLSGLFMQEKKQEQTRKSATKSSLDVKERLPQSPPTPVNVRQSSDFHHDLKHTDHVLPQNPTDIQIPSLPVAPETSDVVAVGSVTPSSSWQNKNILSDHNKKPIPAAFERSKKLGSFSSIVSETTKERYYHESNAPPAAQTILPTALSTHMFLPNNVHQQRMAMRGNGQNQPLEFTVDKTKCAVRRQSMDIPSKNRNNSFLKTRMEISEEESFARAYGRRVKK